MGETQFDTLVHITWVDDKLGDLKVGETFFIPLPKGVSQKVY